MKKLIKNVLCLCGAVLIGMWLSLLMRNSTPLDVEVPVIHAEEITAKEEAQHKAAQASAARAMQKRIFSCATDEDCIIVDKDPCGCLVGPQGVTAINAAYTIDFNKLQEKNVTKTCPEVSPSTTKECSPSARAVCEDRACKIAY